MLALLLIPILVSGYILVAGNLYHHFQLHRHDGQLLYLKVATYGTVSVVIVILFATLTKFFFPDFHPIGKLALLLNIKTIVENNKPGTWLSLISLSSVLLSMIWIGIIYAKNFLLGFLYETTNHESIRHASRMRVLRKVVTSGTLDSMLLDAIENVPKVPVMVTLSSRKVYVGVINGIQEPTENEGPNKHISIFPIMSGYRHKDTLQIEFLNTYKSTLVVHSAATANATKQHKIKYMDIIISVDEISHISWFDFAIFDAVNGSIKQTSKLNINP